MKIIHTSDWDLGKFVNEFSMVDEQKRCLKNFIKVIEKEKPEAILFSGNFYNRFWPTKEAVKLLDETLNTIIVKEKIKLLGILGDSDDPERIIFGSHILEEQGLCLVGRSTEIYKKVILNDGIQKVNVYLIPYKTPKKIAEILKDKTIETYNDSLSKIIESILKDDFNPNEFNIAVYHGYVSKSKERIHKYVDAGLEVSHLDRPISFEGEDIVSSELFKDFDYVALGHLHKGQKLSENMAYSGSIEKYSFEEENEIKSIINLEVLNNKIISIKNEKIKGLRNFKSIDVKAKDIEDENLKKSYDFLNINVTGNCEILNLLKALRKFYPNTMIINREKNMEEKVQNNITFKNMDPLELFEEYYNLYGREVYSDEKKKFIKYIAEKSLREEEK